MKSRSTPFIKSEGHVTRLYDDISCIQPHFFFYTVILIDEKERLATTPKITETTCDKLS